MNDIAERVRDALAVSICRGDDDDPEMWIRLALVQELLEALGDERESHIETAEIMRRAQAQRDHWKDLWRENTAQAAEAMRERDEANAQLADLQRLLRNPGVVEALVNVDLDEILEMELSGDFGEIDDGFGNVWPLCKKDCGLQIVRPGKVQCGCEE